MELTVPLLVYGIVALTHILMQMVLGHAEYGRQLKISNDTQPHRVTVVVPVYNEDPAWLLGCIDSIDKQNYGDMEILVVDDGSPNKTLLEQEVYSRYINSDRVTVIHLDSNVGKRRAQKAAFDIATGDIIVTVDSDTVLADPASISQLTGRFADPEVGAVCAHVQVKNKTRNILTRLITYRYWTAFNQERAAQSYFGVVICCSGPFSAYRRSIISAIEERYVTQRFLGKLCTFGDDRHLTNLVLAEGFKVFYDMKATAYTYVPETLSGYVRQQVRWNKSFYREFLWTMRFVRKHHMYMFYDMLVQFILPFLLVGSLTITAVLAALGHMSVLVWYGASLLGVALLRSVYALYRLRDPGCLLFMLYGCVHIFVLMPVRFYALCTLRKTHWGTR